MKLRQFAQLLAVILNFFPSIVNADNACQDEINELVIIQTKYGNNPEGISPLHYAVLQNDISAIDLLLKYGASPYTKSFHRNSFYFAIIAGKLELVDKFLNLGLDPNEGCDKKTEPLKIAIRENQNKIAKRLINRGISLNKFDHYEHEYLYECCINGNAEIFSFLMKNGAEPHNNDYSEYFKRLLMGPEHKLLDEKITIGKVEIMRYLDSQHLLKISKDNIPFSQIYPEALKFLLDWRFVQPNDKIHNHTLLSSIIWNSSSYELAELLLEYGADANAKNSAEQNVLFALAQHVSGYKKQKDLIVLLIDHGADLNAKDKQGKTLLSYVTNTNMKDFLISLGAQ